jgi:2-hydroxymuconate-semialdehyde hydrolase
METVHTANPEIGQYVHAAGAATNYLQAGHGPEPVVLIHGSGPGVTAYANWRLVLPVLSQDRTVYAYDQKGFGYTEVDPANEYGLTLWLDHLIGFLDALGLNRVSLVGNSMGASVALAAAVRYPERVHKLVLMGATGVRFSLTPGLDAVWGYTASEANMRRLIELFTFDAGWATDELVQLRYRATTRAGVSDTFARMFPAPRQRGIDDLARYEDQYASIRQPTLLVHGLNDQVIPVSTSHHLLELLPAAELHVFAGCGHWAQIEKATRFNALVADFLRA